MIKYVSSVIMLVCFLLSLLVSDKSSLTSESRETLTIEGVYMVTKTYYGLGGMYLENVTYLLFDNGEVLFEPVLSPKVLNVQKSKQDRPDDWGIWRKNEDVIHIKWGNGEEAEITNWFLTEPADNKKVLSGKFQSSDGFGGSVVHNFNTGAFSNQGTFAWKELRGGATSWKPIYSETETAGTYTIDGHEITLTYNNGAIEQFIFYYYPGKQNYFGIGTNDFVPLD